MQKLKLTQELEVRKHLLIIKVVRSHLEWQELSQESCLLHKMHPNYHH